jgi:hypothetical protein
MKRASIFGLVVGVLLFASAASASITTVQNTVDHTAEVGADGPWFAPPDTILDHSPYYRGMWEDWGWTHDLRSQIPHDAVGIESATLDIHAWDVDADDVEPEIDIIYANGVELGMLEDTGGRLWKTTSFEIPHTVLASMWVDGEVFIYMDIDRIDGDLGGHRVTLGHATLTVNYLVSGEGVPLRLSVHRFWSPVLHGHFYTGNETEKNKLISKYADVWIYEGVAYHALPSATELNSAPVYRFWSDILGGHFFTISEREKEKIINEYSDVWTFEGIAWYAFSADGRPAGTLPVYRFWSDALGHHFYTMNEAEKDKIITKFADAWVYEGIVWYAYE